MRGSAVNTRRRYPLKLTRASLSLALLGALACAPAPQAEPAVDLEAVRAELLEADRAWAAAYEAAADKAEAFLSFTEEGIRFLPPDQPMVTGRDGVGEIIAGLAAT
ncbi:MAG: hypothetical protein R3325_14935, partial [Thermoanaerobaculia bacterium]|nr:hypothetical protein [Thermoanaerobaculia bacterium]